MALIFYLIQLLSPLALSTSSQKASVEALETFYGQLNTRVDSKLAQSEIAYSMDVECLSRILLNESSGEPKIGSIYVAQTVINRTHSKDFPDTVCSVMRMKNAFSFFDPKSKHVNKKRHYPKYYTEIAENAVQGKYEGVHSALYYKRCDINSTFFSKLVMVKRIHSHCFYTPQRLVANN